MESNSEWNPYNVTALGLYWNSHSTRIQLGYILGKDKGYGKDQFKL